MHPDIEKEASDWLSEAPPTASRQREKQRNEGECDIGAFKSRKYTFDAILIDNPPPKNNSFVLVRALDTKEGRRLVPLLRTQRLNPRQSFFSSGI